MWLNAVSDAILAINMKGKYLTIAILLLSLLASCHRQQRHDTEVFHYAAERLGLVIPDEPHSFVFVTKEGCTGCKPLALSYAKTNLSDTITFVTTPLLMSLYDVPQRECIVVDSSALIERLNWSLHGIIEVYTTGRKVKEMCDYDINNVTSRFYN